MTENVSNKTALITGASSGFGRATAIELAKSGYNLILGSRNLNQIEQLIHSLPKGIISHGFALDVRQQESIDHFFSNIPAKLKNIDVLINNAGLALGIEPAPDSNLDDWENMVDTNIKGLMRITKSVLAIMVERDRGQIINIGSIAGSWPYPGGNTYGATKAFVQSFSRGLRADLLGKNIRVTNLEPGMAETNFSNVRFKGNEQKASQVYEKTNPLTAEDIAKIISWVCSTPPHVNINSLEVMPTCQAWGPLSVSRNMA